MKEISLALAVLAGGKSRRMGKNKAFLKTKESVSFIEHILSELKSPIFSEVFISSSKELAPFYKNLNVPVITDENQDFGPLEGIRCVLQNGKSDYVFACAVDMPFLSLDLPLFLKEFICSDYDCICPVKDGQIHPLCAIYKKSILPQVEQKIKNKDLRLQNLLDSVRTKYIDLKFSSIQEKNLANINTLADYKGFFSKPYIFCVSGIKNSGKTHLVCRLIKYFKEKNLCVAAIKHDGHDFKADVPGTDSYRFYESGADFSLVYSEFQSLLHKKENPNLKDLIESCKKADIIILEGQKSSSFAKVELVRSCVSEAPVCKKETLICIGTDKNDDFGCKEIPVCDINDTEKIASYIEKYFGIEYGNSK